MNRVYRRRFDWDEARRRYEAGDTVTAIARDFGVSYAAVRRVVVPGAYEADRAAVARRMAGEKGRGCCRNCGTPIHLHTERYRGGRCYDCAGLARSTTVSPTTLRCSTCGEWKPDDSFPPKPSLKARRGRHATCHTCDAALKRAWRAANRDVYNERERERKRRARQAA